MPIDNAIAMSSISAKDAVALPRMNMIAILMPCGTLMLYSGPLAVGKVHVGVILSVPPPTFTTLGFPKRSSAGDSKFDEQMPFHQRSSRYSDNFVLHQRENEVK
jgi:hypothetical protein